jgi:hypothetical protein
VWTCFSCGQIGYMESTFTWFPRRDVPNAKVPICMLCNQTVRAKILEWESENQ